MSTRKTHIGKSDWSNDEGKFFCDVNPSRLRTLKRYGDSSYGQLIGHHDGSYYEESIFENFTLI